MGLIFDLDQTIIDSSIAEPFRKSRNWQTVYSLINRFSIYPGIIEAIVQFHNIGIKICIVTSSPSAYCNKVLHQWNIPFDFTVCYHDTKNKKPHPDPINKALSLLNKEPGKVLSFGDRDIDIIASNTANVPSVACLWGAPDINALIQANPKYMINNSVDLVNLVSNFSI